MPRAETYTFTRFAGAGTAGVDWGQAKSVLLALLVSPAVGFVGAWMLLWAMKRVLPGDKDRSWLWMKLAAKTRPGSVSIVGFGTFAVTKRAARTGRNPRTGTTVAVDELLIGGAGLTGFIGMGGGTANATGLSLTGVNLGLALYTERVTGSATAKKWTSAQASVASASFTGISDLSVTVTSLTAIDPRVGRGRGSSDNSLDECELTVTVSKVRPPKQESSANQ